MANLWETLDEDSKKALIAAHLEGNGGNTPENQNRAREQLINNPTLVAKLAKETGITEGDEVLQDEGDVAEEESIENTVDAALEDEGDVETAGSLPKTLPPPEEGEDVMAYYDRVSAGKDYQDGPVYRNPTLRGEGDEPADRGMRTAIRRSQGHRFSGE